LNCGDFICDFLSFDEVYRIIIEGYKYYLTAMNTHHDTLQRQRKRRAETIKAATDITT
jgi:hypothetical protein